MEYHEIMDKVSTTTQDTDAQFKPIDDTEVVASSDTAYNKAGFVFEHLTQDTSFGNFNDTSGTVIRGLS